MTFLIGDRVWWWNTSNTLHRGVIRDFPTDKACRVEPEGRPDIRVTIPRSRLNHLDTGGAS